ncbi:MAG TPA: hypothetical protein ENJ09_16295, partial [Planctomycetes bacterium]|nr:hypothetical protein [Planctomycetota bacterium]
LFGPGVVSFRLVALVPGILTLLLFFPFVRRLLGGGARSEAPALLATFALAVHPMHVYYTRFGRAYALMLFLELLLLWALVAVYDEEGRASIGRWVLVGVSAALLPVVHLSSASFVLALGLGALLLAWMRGGARALRMPLVVFALAALVAFLAYLPVLEDVRAYFAQTRDTKDHPSTWIGIPVLLAGSAPLAILWLFGLPLFLGNFIARRRVGPLLAAALAGPLAALVVTRPHGMEFAWARYLLIFAPLVPVLLAWGILRVLDWKWGVAGERIGLAVLAIAYGVSFLTGPIRPGRRRVVAFSNTYLAMRELSPFDAPWDGASSVYQEIAADSEARCVVEFPVPVTRAVLLQRNLGRIHGKRVKVGWPGKLPAALAGGGPYVNVFDVSDEDADYLVVHRNLPREVRAFWLSVYDDHLGGRISGIDAGFLLRHQATFIGSQMHVQPAFVEERLGAIHRRLGPPSYVDDDVMAWKLSR